MFFGEKMALCRFAFKINIASCTEIWSKVHANFKNVAFAAGNIIEFFATPQARPFVIGVTINERFYIINRN